MANFKRGTTIRNKWFFRSVCQITGREFWILKNTPGREDRRDPRAEKARQFIEEWKRDVAAEEIEWSLSDIAQLILIAEGTRNVSQCTFTTDGNSVAEIGGGETVRARSEYRT